MSILCWSGKIFFGSQIGQEGSSLGHPVQREEQAPLPWPKTTQPSWKIFRRYHQAKLAPVRVMNVSIKLVLPRLPRILTLPLLDCRNSPDHAHNAGEPFALALRMRPVWRLSLQRHVIHHPLPSHRMRHCMFGGRCMWKARAEVPSLLST
jgi:hypothetical protein